MKNLQKTRIIVGYRLFFSALVMAALVTELARNMAEPHFSIVNFFSFFTIQSNLFGVALLLLASYDIIKRRRAPDQDSLRGAATLYLLTTGLVYALFLSSADVQISSSWANGVLHYLFPVVMLADWLLDPPKRAITLKQSLLWLVYPLLYGVYALIRGPLAGHWYPYPFFDVAAKGYAQVLLNMLSLVLAFAVGAVVIKKLPDSVRSLKKRTDHIVN